MELQNLGVTRNRFCNTLTLMYVESLLRCLIFLFANVFLSGMLLADEPVTLANAEEVAKELGLDSDGRAGQNLPEQQIREKFSLDAATRFLDASSLYWQKQRKCFTCHTNYPYLMARPFIVADDTAHQQVRAFAEQTVTEQWPEKESVINYEVVSTASILAFNDAFQTGRLHDVTRQALARMWTIQRDDGGFDWIRANTAPSELDDHYGVTLALIGVGAAPDGYASAPQAQQGIKKIRDYLADNPPQYPHQSAMLLWAASYIDSLLTPEDQQRRVDELWALQQKDGGWSLLSLGNWPFRGKGGESVARLSDGYGTGLVTYVLRRSGVPVDDVRITRAIHWLKSNQRANGSWLTRSQSDPGGHHSISRAGSAYAIMALAICDELQNVE